MPNWVMNKVHFGNEKVLKECVQKDKNGKYFNFNKVIEMPEEIRNTQAPNDNKEQARELIKKYGAPDWYEWAWNKWGTKWNATETEVTDGHNVEFKTAWSTPVPIFKAISLKYKTRVIVEYADEDIGSNCGRLEIVKGEIVSEKVGDENFADYVWGWADGYNEDALQG